tara:strand:- start:297 stop:758 length:462 start_codon:yes stop_codon:yes gene_type:complete
MDQSDFSFMRSGFNNVIDHDEEQKQQQQLASTLVHFSENALLNAAVYIKHAKRNQITKEDLKRCLMLEVFIFTKRDNLQEKIQAIVEELYENESDDEEEIVFDDDENVIVDEFQESTCQCALCQCINSVYIKWENWEPETHVQHILKRHIEQM